jgi:hypothetical protein
MKLIQRSLIILLSIYTGIASAGGGKLLATAGTTSIEGAAGGGIVPWAVLAGYDARDEIAASVFSTSVNIDDYRLNSIGVALGMYDRLEISAAQQTFDLTSFASNEEIQQNVFGVKYRLLGDVVYGELPQISVGLQHKKLQDGAIAKAVGASSNTSGTDFYIAATKVELSLVNGYNLLWNITARATKANQLGLLGYGGDNGDSYELMMEGSLALLLSRRLAVGIEYRQKPNNLGFAREDDWSDIFVAWFPSKSFNVTAAWANLGDIAGAKDQRGLYLSLTGYLW